MKKVKPNTLYTCRKTGVRYFEIPVPVFGTGVAVLVGGSDGAAGEFLRRSKGRYDFETATECLCFGECDGLAWGVDPTEESGEEYGRHVVWVRAFDYGNPDHAGVLVHELTHAAWREMRRHEIHLAREDGAEPLAILIGYLVTEALKILKPNNEKDKL